MRYKYTFLILLIVLFYNGCTFKPQKKCNYEEYPEAYEKYTNQFKVYEKGFADFFVNIDGFKKPIELRVGVGKPEVLQLEVLNEHIKLLHCFGGNVGTSHLMTYYYTYILDFKNQKIIDIFETYIDYGVDEKLHDILYPKWVLRGDEIHVHYYDDVYYTSEIEHNIKVYKLPKF